MSQFAANDKITVNTHIFVSLALQKRNNFRQEYSSIVLSDFVICCKLGHLSYLEKNVGAKGNWRRDTNMKIHHRIYIVHILIEI
jgi:hypothetical protein